jgi:hypothetical protein
VLSEVSTFPQVGGREPGLRRGVEGFAPKAGNPAASLCSVIFQHPKFGSGAVQTGCVSAETGSNVWQASSAADANAFEYRKCRVAMGPRTNRDEGCKGIDRAHGVVPCREAHKMGGRLAVAGLLVSSRQPG